MESILQKNQEVLITIRNLGINGEGIGYYKRQAVFVTGVFPPEEVVVRITDVKPNHAVAEVVRIKKKAFYRVKPFCPHFGMCGGCQIQHIAYDEQLRLKEDMLKQTFARYTALDVELLDFKSYPAEQTTRGYRHKAQMPVRNIKTGVVTGLYKLNSRELVDIRDCPVHDARINRVNKAVLTLCETHDIRAFDSKTMRGLLRTIVTRVSRATGEIQVTLVVTIYNHALQRLADDLLNEADVVSVAISKLHDASSPQMFGETYEVLAGKPVIIEAIGQVRFALNPKAFFQLNPETATTLYKKVKQLLTARGAKTVADLYCGAGAVALSLADTCDKVIGIDASKDSIASAKQNATLNETSNVHFEMGDAYTTLKALYDKGETFDACVFDPPRTGLDRNMIDLLNRRPVNTLVYISCNPSTLAKNIHALSRKYDVVSVMPFDMFPHTSHVESVTLLSLKTP
ncbi:MAG: 23S rRNA (uracil(1939)-C(5))-methyltransferase RlmD [Acholeplasmatales bacterium]|nr:MAG: 23S rRNA (uracil(1939)-C(5))-methyltransferase RlmD [Acholeplasmatales bacterium]